MAILYPTFEQPEVLGGKFCVSIKSDLSRVPDDNMITVNGGQVYDTTGKLVSGYAIPPVFILPGVDKMYYPWGSVVSNGPGQYLAYFCSTPNGPGPETTINIEVSEGGDTI